MLDSSPSLRQLWLDTACILDRATPPAVVGTLSVATMKADMQEAYFLRPRQALPPMPRRLIPPDFPRAIGRLYNVAWHDMVGLGHDPSRMYLHVLAQSGMVPPRQALREGQWHFDLQRKLRQRDSQGRLPLAIGYGVCNVLPTCFAWPLQDGEVTLEHLHSPEAAQALGDAAERRGHLFHAKPGQVVRWTNLNLHRGTPNLATRPVRRIFLHVAFSPTGGYWRATP